MENTDTVYGTLSTRVFANHHAMVRRAADAHGVTLSEYLRGLILGAVAYELGLPPPDLTIYSGKDLLATAAAAEGLDVRTWSNKVLRQAAAAALRSREAISRSEETLARVRSERPPSGLYRRTGS